MKLLGDIFIMAAVIFKITLFIPICKAKHLVARRKFVVPLQPPKEMQRE